MSSAPDIFKDKQLQEQFEKDGYVKVTLLSHENVKQLHDLYHHYFPDPSTDFFSSSNMNDYKKKKEISDAIGQIIVPNLDAYFIDYTWFGSAYLSKGNGPRSEMPMHQDWSIVDEKKYVALNIWTPLQETIEENGTLEMIPGSHLWPHTLRAPTIPFYYNGFQQELKKKLVVVPTLPTEAIVLNQAVIHYSKANKTDQLRIAITSGIKTKDAPMLFHYFDKTVPDRIEIFKQDEDFLLRFEDFHQDIFVRPVIGESLGYQAFQLIQPSVDDVNKLTNTNSLKEDAIKKATLTQKLVAWIRS